MPSEASRRFRRRQAGDMYNAGSLTFGEMTNGTLSDALSEAVADDGRKVTPRPHSECTMFRLHVEQRGASIKILSQRKGAIVGRYRGEAGPCTIFTAKRRRA